MACMTRGRIVVTLEHVSSPDGARPDMTWVKHCPRPALSGGILRANVASGGRGASKKAFTLLKSTLFLLAGYFAAH
jgi:hypothetical protein